MFRKKVGSKSSFRLFEKMSFWFQRLSDPALTRWDYLHKSQRNLWSLSHIEPTFFLNTLPNIHIDVKSALVLSKYRFAMGWFIWFLSACNTQLDNSSSIMWLLGTDKKWIHGMVAWWRLWYFSVVQVEFNSIWMSLLKGFFDIL